MGLNDDLQWVGNAAATVGIEDASNLITSDNVEGALREIRSKLFYRTLAATTAADTSAASTSNEIAITGTIPVGTTILSGTYSLPHGFSNPSKADTAITMSIGWAGKGNAIANAVDISEDAAGISSNPMSLLLTGVAVSNGVTALKATFTSASNLSVLTSGQVSATLLCTAPIED
jgi:hypothetical protein